MKTNKNSMAIIVLCSHLCVGNDVKPFTPNEWSNLALLLVENKMTPYDLINLDTTELKKKLSFSDVQISRIERLISRSASLTFELEKLSSIGIGIVTRADKEYPIMLKRGLGNKCPPLFYYAGDISLANRKLIGFVGSRSITDEDMNFTKVMIARVIKKGYGIVSGGAKGIDSIASESALANGGFAVEYLSDSLMKKIKTSSIITTIKSGQLLILSSTNPNTGFNVGNAMARNKYIYANSIGTVIVKSDYNKGGTWSGALENSNHDWTKMFCWNNLFYKGNVELIKRGAFPIDENWDINLEVEVKKNIKNKQISLFD